MSLMGAGKRLAFSKKSGTSAITFLKDSHNMGHWNRFSRPCLLDTVKKKKKYIIKFITTFLHVTVYSKQKHNNFKREYVTCYNRSIILTNKSYLCFRQAQAIPLLLEV